MRTRIHAAVFLLVTLSLLAGCKRSENSITGMPGVARALSGQVQPVGDLAGSSPAGINVSSNGQIATTDAAGRFSFVSLPDKSVTLSFTRADGINASASVGASAGAVVVQLEKKKASVVTTGQSKREIEGLIVKISPDSITVNDASTGGPVTAKITESTVIRKGNQTLSVATLKVGDRVHVKASVNLDKTLTAFEIKLQNAADGNGGGGQTRELEGLILAVSDTEITVNNASTGGPVTAKITSSTVIRKGNTTLKASDLKVGNRVHVKTSAAGDGTLTALEIKLQN